MGWVCGLALLGGASSDVHARSFETNEFRVQNAPAWLSETRFNRAAQKIERVLEWDIRKANVVYIAGQAEFEAVHGLGPSVVAVTRKASQEIFLGPRVTPENFESVFGHELGHLILGQKYKSAIPAWLEEGLANFAAKRGRVDYPHLAGELQKRPVGRWSVRDLVHPFKGVSDPSSASEAVRFHYDASTALAELLAKRCGMSDLLQLSVGSHLERYLATTCQISELDRAFRDWVTRKGQSGR